MNQNNSVWEVIGKKKKKKVNTKAYVTSVKRIFFSYKGQSLKHKFFFEKQKTLVFKFYQISQFYQ